MNPQKEAKKQFDKQFEDAFTKARNSGFSIKKIKQNLLKQYDKQTINKHIVVYYYKRALFITFISIVFILLLAVIFFVL